MNGQSGAAGSGTPSHMGASDSSAGAWLHPAPSLGEHTIDTVAGRVLCIADIRGKISKLNDLADRHNAKAIIHTGDFGFYDKDSVERITHRTLRHVVHYSSLIDAATKEKYFPTQENPKDTSKAPLSLGQLREALLNPSPEQINDQHGQDFILSEFPKLLRGEITLKVPVYTVWGACEDVHIIEKLRLAAEPNSTSPTNKNSKDEYAIPNLTVLSEGVSRVLNIGGIKLRLFGLGGSVVYHKLFDNGEGNATIAGGSGTMWTTALQIGELVDTAQRVYDATETRLLVTHASPGREGLLAQLALAIKADYTISGSLHFRYGASYNDFATQSEPSVFRNKLLLSNKRFREVYDIVKSQVESAIDNQQKKLLKLAVGVADRIPSENMEEFAWKNSWHWNLPDALYGSLILDIRDGRLGSEQKSTGFNFAYRLSLNNKTVNAREVQGPTQTQAQPPVTNPAQPQSHAQNQGGPAKRPNQVPFHQQRVFSNPRTTGHGHQETPKQGYIGSQKPNQGQQQQEQVGVPSAPTRAPAMSTESQDAAAVPANPPPAGPSFGARGPPTPRDFDNLASMAFKTPVGAGRGRGSPSSRGHQKGASSGTGRSSPADPAGLGKKETDNKVVASSSNGTPANDPAPSTSAVTDSQNGAVAAGMSVKSENPAAGPGIQKRTSSYNQGRGGRDESANWRVRGDADKAKDSQPEESGNESPAGGSSFRGRGRGRGTFEGARGRGDGFRGGRGGSRPEGAFRGNSFDGARGARGRGRGGARASNEGETALQAEGPAKENAKSPVPPVEGGSAA